MYNNEHGLFSKFMKIKALKFEGTDFEKAFLIDCHNHLHELVLLRGMVWILFYFSCKTDPCNGGGPL